VQEPSEAEVVRNDAQSRYELHVDGEVMGVVDFRVERDGTVAYTHTEVDHALRGKGFSPVLVSRALDDARERGDQVVPKCSYVRDFRAEHPEYADVFTG
jgi:predicted GNAT family acetyltransferase